jgi:glutathione S-transferase
VIRIYDFPSGARGLRAAWLCEEIGLAYQLVPAAYPPDSDYLARHKLGTVPFLVDGAVGIAESVAMLIYLAEAYGPTPLLPARHEPGFAPVLELTLFGEASLGAGLNPLIAAAFLAPEEAKRSWSVLQLEAQIERRLRYLAERLNGAAYAVGNGLTLADISIETALRIWQGPLAGAIPAGLATYRAGLAERPAYRRALAVSAGTR